MVSIDASSKGYLVIGFDFQFSKVMCFVWPKIDFSMNILPSILLSAKNLHVAIHPLKPSPVKKSKSCL